MLSYLTLITGVSNDRNFIMKSIITDCHGFFSFWIFCGALLICVLYLFRWQLSQRWMKFVIYFFMLSKWHFHYIAFIIFIILRWLYFFKL